MTKVLIIEDEAHIRDEVLDWLNFGDYEGIGAPNGQEGVQMALDQLPDLIISDINMPEMDGYRVLVELRTHPSTALIPFIFLTACTERSDVRQGMALGAEDYITKPFTYDELMGAVKSQIAKIEMHTKQIDKQLDELRHTLTRSLPEELITPLVTILGFSEIITIDADKMTTEDMQNVGKAIFKNGQRLHRAIEKYQILNQIENHSTEVELSNLQPAIHVDEPDRVVAKACERVLRKFDRLPDVRFDLQGPCQTVMDEENLEHIVTELIDNACKFSTQKTPIDVITRLEAGAYKIHVVDHGRGLNAEEMEQVKTQLHLERGLCPHQDVGLGLIIVNRIVSLHKGSLTITSTPYRETIVSVNLPVSKP